MSDRQREKAKTKKKVRCKVFQHMNSSSRLQGEDTKHSIKTFISSVRTEQELRAKTHTEVTGCSRNFIRR